MEVIEEEAVEVEAGGGVVEGLRREEGVDIGGPFLKVLVEDAEEGEAAAGLGDDRAEDGVELEFLDGEVAEVEDGAGSGAGGG